MLRTPRRVPAPTRCVDLGNGPLRLPMCSRTPVPPVPCSHPMGGTEGTWRGAPRDSSIVDRSGGSSRVAAARPAARSAAVANSVSIGATPLEAPPSDVEPKDIRLETVPLQRVRAMAPTVPPAVPPVRHPERRKIFGQRLLGNVSMSRIEDYQRESPMRTPRAQGPGRPPRDRVPRGPGPHRPGPQALAGQGGRAPHHQPGAPDGNLADDQLPKLRDRHLFDVRPLPRPRPRRRMPKNADLPKTLAAKAFPAPSVAPPPEAKADLRLRSTPPGTPPLRSMGRSRPRSRGTASPCACSRPMGPRLHRLTRSAGSADDVSPRPGPRRRRPRTCSPRTPGRAGQPRQAGRVDEARMAADSRRLHRQDMERGGSDPSPAQSACTRTVRPSSATSCSCTPRPRSDASGSSRARPSRCTATGTWTRSPPWTWRRTVHAAPASMTSLTGSKPRSPDPPRARLREHGGAAAAGARTASHG